MSLLASPFPAQADQNNHLIRAIVVASGVVTTLAGRQGVTSPFTDGIGSVATFNFPSGISVDGLGTVALVVCVSL
jgi:hypothetical protein